MADSGNPGSGRQSASKPKLSPDAQRELDLEPTKSLLARFRRTARQLDFSRRRFVGNLTLQGWLALLAAAGSAATAPPAALAAEPTTAATTPASFATRTAAIAARIPAPQVYFRTAGYAAAGDGGHALYKAVADTGDLLPWQLRTNDGTRRWQLVPNEDGSVNTKQLGAKADWNGVSGTDDTAAIQATIDYTIYSGEKCKARLAPGAHKTTNTIHLGYGDGFHVAVLEGIGGQFRPSTGWVGSSICAQFSDRPAISSQGGRLNRIRGIGIFGLNHDHIVKNALGTDDAFLDDTDPNNWVASSLHANADSRYAPYAGIAIDPFSGDAPPTPYPRMTYPAYANSRTQYNKNFSSDTLIEDCYIDGFVVGVVNQPCDADGNGDFTRIRDTQIVYCKYACSVGNTQSRNVELDCLNTNQVYCSLTNRAHGRRLGLFEGPITNCTFGATMKIIDFGSIAHAGPLVFSHCYSELLYRIGDFEGGTAVESSITFHHCTWNFQLHTDARGMPANVLKQEAGSRVNVDILGCAINLYKGALVFDCSDVRFGAGTVFQPAVTLAEEYQYLAQYGTSGGVIIKPGIRESKIQDLHWSGYLPDGTAGAASVITDGVSLSKRALPVPVLARFAAPFGSPFGETLQAPQRVNAIDKSEFSSLAISGRTLSVTFRSPRSDAIFRVSGPLPGDVLYDEATGTTFWVSSRTGESVRAVAMNNYKTDGVGGHVLLSSVSSSAGLLYCLVTRYFVPDQPLFGDTSPSGAVISNAGRADGYGAFITTELVVDDAMYLDATRDATWTAENSKVTARTTSSVTLSGNASKTTTQKRFPWWIRKAAANA